MRTLAEQSLAIDRGDVEALAHLQRLDALDGELEAARRLAEQSDAPEAHVHLSLLYYRAGRYRRRWRPPRAAELRPSYAAAHKQHCRGRKLARRWDEGAAAARIAVTLDPPTNRPQQPALGRGPSRRP